MNEVNKKDLVDSVVPVVQVKDDVVAQFAEKLNKLVITAYDLDLETTTMQYSIDPAGIEFGINDDGNLEFKDFSVFESFLYRQELPLQPTRP